MPAKCLVKVHKNSRKKKKNNNKTSWASLVHISNPTYYFDFHNSAHEPRATCSILEARTNVTKKNERILIKDLISYKLKHRTKEARLILQPGIYNFWYQYFGQHGLVLFMWSPKKCIISTATLSFSYIFFFLNSSVFHLNSFWKKRGDLDMYLLEMMIKEFMVSRVFL